MWGRINDPTHLYHIASSPGLQTEFTIFVVSLAKIFYQHVQKVVLTIESFEVCDKHPFPFHTVEVCVELCAFWQCHGIPPHPQSPVPKANPRLVPQIGHGSALSKAIIVHVRQYSLPGGMDSTTSCRGSTGQTNFPPSKTTGFPIMLSPESVSSRILTPPASASSSPPRP